MRRILYVMHVPWAWIKQRPHFLAEYLSKEYRVDVFYKKPFKVASKNLLNRHAERPNLFITDLCVFPFYRFKLLNKLSFINNILIKHKLPKPDKYDFVWITSPLMYGHVKNMCKNKAVIYDCMDDAAEFPIAKNNPLVLNEVLKNEAELLNKAKFVLCSSDYLKNAIQKRANINREVFVVNNAISLPNTSNNTSYPKEIQIILEKIKSLSNTLLYIGTISEWFDFDLIYSVIDSFPSLNLVLIGPVDCEIPSHDRIIHLGTVQRQYIYPIMEAAWALVMPFKVNELIRSVNPVKIYEYIFMKKRIISPYYEEMNKFSQYVYLYHNVGEFKAFIKEMLNEGTVVSKQEGEQMELFAKSNTWEARYEQISRIISNL